MKFVKESLILICSLIMGASLMAAYEGNKTWYSFEGCTKDATGADGCFFFLEDRETHTRCYAFRTMYHDGASINCVPNEVGRQR